MTNFILLDLYSQREAVTNYVWRWSIEEVLEWMKQYGTITKIESEYDDHMYSFRSKSGAITPFRFAKDGSLVIFK